jgi:hypothetical protein
MTIAKYEKNQLLWAAKGVKVFLKMAVEKKTISQNHAEAFDAEIEKITTEKELNDIIARLNQVIDHTDPFPFFSLVSEEAKISGAMAHITFFQRLLKEGVSPQESAMLWQQAFLLWQHVEMQEIAPYYGITKLAGMVKEANRLLPQPWQLPLVDLESYE